MRGLLLLPLLLLLGQAVPAGELYGQALSVLNVVLPIMITLILLVVLLLVPVRTFRDLVDELID